MEIGELIILLLNIIRIEYIEIVGYGFVHKNNLIAFARIEKRQF